MSRTDLRVAFWEDPHSGSLDHREEIYREETRGKLCHADIFSLNYYINLYLSPSQRRGAPFRA
jgi:hypothetical protein